jgi:hypothetical protein
MAPRLVQSKTPIPLDDKEKLSKKSIYNSN